MYLRDNSAIPMVAAAQYTGEIDWSQLTLQTFGSGAVVIPLPDGTEVTLEFSPSAAKLTGAACTYILESRGDGRSGATVRHGGGTVEIALFS